MNFWPLWPQMTQGWPLTPQSRGYQAYVYAWSYGYVIWRSYSIFDETELLTPVTPNDPKFKFEPITFIGGI